MPAPFDHALALLVAVLWPLWEYTIAEPRARRAIIGGAPGARARFYRIVLAKEWLLALVVLAWWLRAGRHVATLGLRPSAGPGLWIGLVLTVLVIALQAQQVHRVATRETSRAKVRPAFAKLGWILPHTVAELRVFSALSVTAGVCEELLFRGFLITYLAWSMPWPAALLVSSVAFGFGHAYQGPRGIVQTGLVGLAMGGLYALTGALWVPMAVHAAVDIGSGYLTHFVLREDVASPVATSS